MKATSIIVIILGVAITIFCLTYFKPALNVADSDAMTINPKGGMTSAWPLFIGILTTFVGVCFFIASLSKKAVR